MATICDFVLALDGVTTFKLPTWNKDFAIRGTEAYFARRKQLNQDRAYFLAGCSTKDADIPATRDALIADMRKQAGGQFQRGGVVCLFGSSNGAAHALAIAAAMPSELTINFVCLADLPIFAGGRNPPIPGVGNLPASDPVLIRRATSLVTTRVVGAEGDRPKVTLTPDISAKVKENYFQHNGNGIKPHTFSSGWFWTSDMAAGEVHGMITNAGWKNIEVTGLTIDHPDLRAFFGGKGDAFHVALDDHVETNIWSKRWPAELAKF